MICVRCLAETATKIAEAPDKSGDWELYFCSTCHYSWRNNEQDCITDIAKRDPWAQLDGEKLVAVKENAGGDYITLKQRPEGWTPEANPA